MAQWHVLWFYRWLILKSVIFKSIFWYPSKHWLEVYSTMWLSTALYWHSCDKSQEKRFQERIFRLTDASVYDILMRTNFFSLVPSQTSKATLSEIKNPRFVSQFLKPLLTLLPAPFIYLLMSALILGFK